MFDINSFYDELEKELDEKTKDILEKVKDKIENDPEYRELKKKDIKLIIYNNRNKITLSGGSILNTSQKILNENIDNIEIDV